MTRKNLPKKASCLNLSVCFYVWNKYKLCTCMCKTCTKSKKCKFLFSVSDKNTYHLATYIHLSIWLFGTQTAPSINFGSHQKGEQRGHGPPTSVFESNKVQKFYLKHQGYFISWRSEIIRTRNFTVLFFNFTIFEQLMAAFHFF